MNQGIARFASEGSSGADDQLIGSNASSIQSIKKTLLSGEVIERGEVVGLVTATGKARAAVAANGDGSAVPYGIAVHDMDATGGDKDLLVYIAGHFNENQLIIGAGLTVAGIREGLRGKGIFLETPIKANAS